MRGVILPSSKGCYADYVISYHILYIKLCLVYSIFHYSLSVLSSLDAMFFVRRGYVSSYIFFILGSPNKLSFSEYLRPMMKCTLDEATP